MLWKIGKEKEKDFHFSSWIRPSPATARQRARSPPSLPAWAEPNQWPGSRTSVFPCPSLTPRTQLSESPPSSRQHRRPPDLPFQIYRRRIHLQIFLLPYLERLWAIKPRVPRIAALIHPLRSVSRTSETPLRAEALSRRHRPPLRAVGLPWYILGLDLALGELVVSCSFSRYSPLVDWWSVKPFRRAPASSGRFRPWHHRRTTVAGRCFSFSLS
jgi:hypothetical protein